MTFDLDPQLSEEVEYEAPKEHQFELREDETEPGIVGHLKPDEVTIFHRLRDEQQREHGATKVRGMGMEGMLKVAEQARAEARG